MRFRRKHNYLITEQQRIYSWRLWHHQAFMDLVTNRLYTRAICRITTPTPMITTFRFPIAMIRAGKRDSNSNGTVSMPPRKSWSPSKTRPSDCRGRRQSPFIRNDRFALGCFCSAWCSSGCSWSWPSRDRQTGSDTPSGDNVAVRLASCCVSNGTTDPSESADTISCRVCFGATAPLRLLWPR